MNNLLRTLAPSILILTCAVFFLPSFSTHAKQKETRLVSKNKAYSFALPQGWMKDKKAVKNTIVIFQAQKKALILNPYITFSYVKLNNVPSTPPPDDLWGQRIVKRIKEVDEKSKIISAEPSIVAGKPAYAAAAYLSYKKLKKHRTFQKSWQVWDGKRKTMMSFILVCLESDRKMYEPVLGRLIKSVKIKSQG